MARTSRLFGLAIVLFCAAIPCQLAHAQGKAGPATISRMSWLAGSWSSSNDGVTVEELWTAAAGGTMLGVSRTVRGGQTVSFEYLRIVERDGRLVFIAQPGGGAAVEFRFAQGGTGQALFESLSHDNPKRILYRAGIDGTLLTRTQGIEKGKPVTVEVKLIRR